MTNSIGKLTLAGLLAAVVLGVPVRVSAQETNPPAATAPAVNKKHKFSGKLAALDKVAMTITVQNKGGQPNRVIYITSDTRIKKNGKPGTLDDGVIGDKVAGSYRVEDDKKLANTVDFISRPETGANAPAATPAPAEPAK